MDVARRDRFRTNPFGTCAAIAAVILGLLGIIIGDRVSQGMTESLRASAWGVAHLWGAGFMAGGCAKLYGLYQGRTTVEIPGLWMMAGGYVFYAITVVVGLGQHGIAAGTLSTAMAVGCVAKTRLIMAAAARASARHDPADGPPGST